jgi:T5orf172 domain-containing protein
VVEGCVYVEGVPGLAAVRIGRTKNLLQRLRWFEYDHFPVEVLLVGECTDCAFAPEEAETAIFRALEDLRLWRHDAQVWVNLETGDWFLPDRRRILDAFSRLCKGRHPLLARYYTWPLFDQISQIYTVGEAA